jgi:5-methylcytosine-specific restriction protein A
MENDIFILRKEVDWSTLMYGFNIPVSIQSQFSDMAGFKTAIGEKRIIKIIIQGESYQANLTNIAFDRNNYPTHKDLLQIRYSEKSALSQKLRDIFITTYNYTYSEKLMQKNKREHIIIPESIMEYFVLSTTSIPDTFIMDCFTTEDKKEISDYVSKISEEECEYYFKADAEATILKKDKLIKVRKVDRSICENLKHIYDYRCQVTGEKIGDEFGESVVEAHHIAYFTKSLNNDSSNIIIISPNFHRIIHKNNPEFDLKNLCFRFPNGVVEKLKINKHLGINL